MAMKHAHIITPTGILALIKGRRFSCASDSARYKQVLSAINANDDEAFAEAMQASEVKALASAVKAKNFKLVAGEVVLDGIKIIGALQQKLQRMIREGLDVSHFAAFIRNLRKNPSHTAVKELYDFLAYSELPITVDGLVVAYKGVRDDYWSVTSGSMKLKKGKVDANGRCYNGVGEELECERVNVDDDRRQACSNGLHVGSYEYATGFGSKTVVVHVNPKDVVSVPLDCSYQKMRVCAYKVVEDLSHEIKDAVVDSHNHAVKGRDAFLAELLDEKVATLKKRGGAVTLKRLQSALSPECEPLHTIRDILTSRLGYTVCVDPHKSTSVGCMFVE